MKKLPKKIGKYNIQKKISEGGMSSVYLAEHPGLKRFVIIKKLKNLEGVQAIERFEREARIMMDLRNEGIVQVHDYFNEGSYCYTVMEYVDGLTLEELLDKKRIINNDFAMLIIREVCKALKYSHDNGIIHRDIKPANIMISRNGEVKLTDFGIATSNQDAGDGLTIEGMTLGTPAYMPPEQFSRSKYVDHRADIYSVGVTLYEIVCGKKPFPGGFNSETLDAIHYGRFISPRKINPRIKRVILRVIKKTMHRKYARRYKDIKKIITTFTKHLKAYKNIKESIYSYIWENNNEKTFKKTEPIRQKKKHTKLIKSSVTAITCAILLGISGLYCYNHGYFHELFFSSSIGALRIKIKVNKFRINKDPKDLYIKTFLYKKEKGILKRVKDVSFNYKNNSLDNETIQSKWYHCFTSKKKYLNAGHYFLNIHCENQNFQKHFYLQPRCIQKMNKATISAEEINFTLVSGIRQPLYVYYTVRDIRNRKNITASTDLYIYYYGWKKWNKFIRLKNYKKILTSGKRYLFKIHKKNYYTKFHRIYVNHYQNILSLNIHLTPIPGKMYIDANKESLRVLINNSNYYFWGGKSRKYKKLEKTITGQWQKILLDPGYYRITVKKSSSIKRSANVVIKSGSKMRLKITYDSTKKNIALRVIK